MSFIIYPTQLFQDISLLKDFKKIFLIEDNIYFTRYKFHRLKLAYHKATMLYYYDYLRDNLSATVKYIKFQDSAKFYKSLRGPVDIYDPVDHLVMDNLLANKKIELTIHETLAFPETREELQKYKDDLGNAQYRHDSSFYRWQRRNLDVLLTRNSKPKGGKWTYDAENRDKFPPGQKEPYNYRQPRASNYVSDGIRFARRFFAQNPGSLDNFIYPVDHAGAKAHFKAFLENKFRDFGQYQDAFDEQIIFGYHSVISCVLNTGLLTPMYVLEKALKFAKKHRIPMNSLEGFIRQLIGWRSYCRFIYIYEGAKMRRRNYFGHKKRLTQAWWDGSTGILPLDNVIKKVRDYAYAHHIERLMIVGAMMLMCQVHPDEVFAWFIGFCSIDAYDWVMVPNIYGMSQYADGGIMMTRPYFSSSNYVRKMSNYSAADNGDEFTWAEAWDAIYYSFIDKHAEKLASEYSSAMQVKHWKKKSPAEKSRLKKIAKSALENMVKN